MEQIWIAEMLWEKPLLVSIGGVDIVSVYMLIFFTYSTLMAKLSVVL